MSIWKQIVRIFRSRENRDADDIGALTESLDASYRAQLGLLQRVRRGVADVATSRKRVELQIAQLKRQGGQYDEAAKAAVARGSDDEARAALTRKVTLEKTIEGLASQHADLKAEEDKLDDSAQQIEARIEEFRLRKDTLSARHTAAAARAEINSATTGITSQMGDVGHALKTAEQRTRELEAHADAVDELVADGIISGPDGAVNASAAFDRQFAALGDESNADVDRQLESLKSRAGGGAADGTDAIQE